MTQLVQYLNRKIYSLIHILFSNNHFLRKKQIPLLSVEGHKQGIKAESAEALLTLNNSKIFLKGTCQFTSRLWGSQAIDTPDDRGSIRKKLLQLLAAFVIRSRKYPAICSD